MSDSYWNWEDDSDIICPYCGEVYEPSYEETYIGDKIADCYTEDTEIYTCDCCHRRFEMRGYQVGWNYYTETIDGELSEKEHENKVWLNEE